MHSSSMAVLAMGAFVLALLVTMTHAGPTLSPQLLRLQEAARDADAHAAAIMAEAVHAMEQSMRGDGGGANTDGAPDLQSFTPCGPPADCANNCRTCAMAMPYKRCCNRCCLQNQEWFCQHEDTQAPGVPANMLYCPRRTYPNCNCLNVEAGGPGAFNN